MQTLPAVTFVFYLTTIALAIVGLFLNPALWFPLSFLCLGLSFVSAPVLLRTRAPLISFLIPGVYCLSFAAGCAPVIQEISTKQIAIYWVGLVGFVIGSWPWTKALRAPPAHGLVGFVIGSLPWTKALSGPPAHKDHLWLSPRSFLPSIRLFFCVGLAAQLLTWIISDGPALLSEHSLAAREEVSSIAYLAMLNRFLLVSLCGMLFMLLATLNAPYKTKLELSLLLLIGIDDLLL